MPKTNHERGFSDKRDYTVPPGDHCRGKHGAAKKRRGEKKFRRSRQRFHQNAQLSAMVDEDASLDATKFDRGWKKESKLRFKGGQELRCTGCGKTAKMLLVVVPLEVEICKTCRTQHPVE